MYRLEELNNLLKIIEKNHKKTETIKHSKKQEKEKDIIIFEDNIVINDDSEEMLLNQNITCIDKKLNENCDIIYITILSLFIFLDDNFKTIDYLINDEIFIPYLIDKKNKKYFLYIENILKNVLDLYEFKIKISSILKTIKGIKILILKDSDIEKIINDYRTNNIETKSLYSIKENKKNIIKKQDKNENKEKSKEINNKKQKPRVKFL